jgi:hypothetical protein
MTLRSYLTGNEVLLSATFTSVPECVLTNPTTVTVQTLDPSGNIVEYTNASAPAVVNPSLGVFQCTITPVLTGIWKYRWEGAGAVIAASEQSFEIRPSAFMS